MTEEIRVDLSVDNPQFTQENLPKTKEEWNTWRNVDPDAWAEATQANTDKLFREKKELEEKLGTVESQKSNLTAELETYRTTGEVKPEVHYNQTVQIPAVEKPAGPVVYNRENLPQTKEEWDKLALDEPTLAIDLRNHYTNTVAAQQNTFQETQAASRRTVQAEHPDMYLAELDANGNPQKDDKGNVVLKRDANGEALFNDKSEKGKLWVQIFNENPRIAENAAAPELLMATMERRLRVSGEQVVKDVNDQREQHVQDGQVLAEGITPPPKVEVKFANDEEQKHAQGMVNRGLYPTLEDYVINRDAKDEGIYDENRMPSFNSKK
jgi:hypothetical protein